MDWLRAIFLGVVQGVTEFLPISSDGHLALFQILFGGTAGSPGRDAGAEHLFFDVMLHVGTAAAIVLHYRKQVAAGARGLLGSPDVPDLYRRPPLARTGLLVVVATLPLIPLALFFKKALESTFDNLWFVGGGFLATSAILLLTLRLPGGKKGPAEITWVDALIVGIAQTFAPLPGVSRSGSTIATALALGFSKSWAVGFSLMMAVPAILGAAILEIRKVDPGLLTPAYLARTTAAATVAGAVGYLAITWLVRVVRGGRLWYFSVYLVAVGALALGLAATRGGRTDAGEPPSLDRAEPLGAARPGGRGVPAGAGDRLGRAVGRGATAGRRPGGRAARPDPGRPDLDLG
jgi:undecaprenyl-diphosphatase